MNLIPSKSCSSHLEIISMTQFHSSPSSYKLTPKGIVTRSTNVVVTPIIDKYLEHMFINYCDYTFCSTKWTFNQILVIIPNGNSNFHQSIMSMIACWSRTWINIYYPILFVTHISNGHVKFTLLVSNNILFGDIIWDIFSPILLLSNFVICIYLN